MENWKSAQGMRPHELHIFASGTTKAEMTRRSALESAARLVAEEALRWDQPGLQALMGVAAAIRESAGLPRQPEEP